MGRAIDASGKGRRIESDQSLMTLRLRQLKCINSEAVSRLFIIMRSAVVGLLGTLVWISDNSEPALEPLMSR